MKNETGLSGALQYVNDSLQVTGKDQLWLVFFVFWNVVKDFLQKTEKYIAF